MTTTLKQLDSRIRSLLFNGVQEKKRSFVVVVGDDSKNVIVNLYHIWSGLDINHQKKPILWAYKKNLLGFTSHRKKRELKIKKEIKRGIREANTEDPFELFVSLSNIRYVYYKESEKILGNTFGMCILQDFEAITPNLLAKTIETVEGGGLVVLLLRGMTSLKQLYTMSMDVHKRYRTEAHQDVTARFNERFLLSLGRCESCLIMDDEMNVLPISGAREVKALPPLEKDQTKTQAQIELENIKSSLEDVQPLGSLVNLARTVDQAKALQKFVEFIAKKTFNNTLTLQAARGRGKSAALGVSIAAAIAHGYSSIYITSPSPENIKTLFEFVFKGFDALGYSDHLDYTIMQSKNPDFNKAVVKVNVHRDGHHRQIIQYIRPEDAHVLGQAELLVIDEAAAIPLPVVRKLMGPYLVFMASTINGYEGTGRSLSLKLVKELKKEAGQGGRSLEEIDLVEPIRYAKGDAVEKWLNTVLCLDATIPPSRLNTLEGCPDPSQCELLCVNRDTLFSFHEVSEKFLQQMVALYVASHYKNSPDDLQLMSDAPAHRLFVLVPPGAKNNAKRIPEPLCVIQVALEGQISKESVLNALNRGLKKDGDLIPWVVSSHFQEDNFAGLSGARIVRIATNPNYSSMGYGSKALELLIDFYEGKFANLSEDGDSYQEETMTRVSDAELAQASLRNEKIHVREVGKMPPLFTELSNRRPDNLDWIGVSYGLTQQLHRFWKKASFAPVYLRKTTNDLTGEHSCIMLRQLANKEDVGLDSFSLDFKQRFLKGLSKAFKDFTSTLALTLIESANKGARLDKPENKPRPLTITKLEEIFTQFDLRRLEQYANGNIEYSIMDDLEIDLAMLYFRGSLDSVMKLSGVQASILLAVGLQRKHFSDIEKEFKLEPGQIMAMFTKTVKKMLAHFSALKFQAVDAEMPKDVVGVSRADADEAFDDEVVNADFEPLEQDLEAELEEGGEEAVKELAERQALRDKQRQLIDALPLDQYEIGKDTWEEIAGEAKKGKGVVSVKSSKPKRAATETAAEIYEQEFGERKHKKAKKEKSGKKGRS